MGGVMRGPGELKVEGIRVIDNPHHVKEIARLTDELAIERAKPIQVIERPVTVDRVIEKIVQDTSILTQLNSVLKENAELKKFQPRTHVVEKPIDRIIEKEVLKYVDRIVPQKPQYKLAAGIAAAGLLLGSGLTATLKHKDVTPCQTSSISQTLKPPASTRR